MVAYGGWPGGSGRGYRLRDRCGAQSMVAYGGCLGVSAGSTKFLDGEHLALSQFQGPESRTSQDLTACCTIWSLYLSYLVLPATDAAVPGGFLRGQRYLRQNWRTYEAYV